MTQDTQSIIALVTGANQGIGRAVATSLAKDHGYHVLVGSRNLEAGEAVAAELRATGHKATAIQLDLVSDESINAAIAAISDKFGRLDVLVNNAGVLLDSVNRYKVLPVLPTRELFERTYQANVFGPAVLTEGLLPLLRKTAASAAVPPRVVFVSSIMASLAIESDPKRFWGKDDYKAYWSSKTAVNALMVEYTQALADVGGLVNAVCPGFVKTNMNGFSDVGVTVEDGAKPIVGLATLGPDGPRGTFTNKDGPIPW